MAVKTDWKAQRKLFSEREQVLCAFAEKLTLHPSATTPADLDLLREQGLSDGAITEVVHVVGYFNHINRVADALGVDREGFMHDGGASTTPSAES